MTGFDTIENADDLVAYSNHFLYRVNRNASNLFLSHYTKVEALEKIVSTNSFLLRHADSMNDAFEYQSGDPSVWNKKYYISFSNQGVDESIAMWHMYGKLKDGDGVILRVPYSALRKLVLDKADVSAFYSDESSLHYEEECSLSVSSIVYRQKRGMGIACGRVKNFNKALMEQVYSKDHISQLTGYLKWRCWDPEKEVRLFLNGEEDFPTKDMKLTLPKDFFSQCHVVTSPLFKKELPPIVRSTFENRITPSLYKGELNEARL